MATIYGDEGGVGNGTHSGFFHRSLSPRSFERLRAEHSDYFYKPKRGPSASKSNITITRPIKTFETVTNLVELLSKGNNKKTSNKNNVEDIDSPPLSKKFDDQRSSSRYSSFLSMDGGDLSSSTSTSSSAFSSRSNSSISTVAEQETQVIIIDEPQSQLTQTTSFSSKSEPNETIIDDDDNKTYSSSSCHVPVIGLNIVTTGVHLVLLELYPQNVNYSTIIFQRYLISLIHENEHKDWSILSVDLHTITEQEGNFRLFTLTHEEFDLVLIRLQSFIRYNISISASFTLNIALTGEQTNEYESKISSKLNKINLNFDFIQYRAESYMIGLDFFLRKQNRLINQDDELIEILHYNHKIKQNKPELYPYILVHAEAASTFFYIVHSPSKYSVITSNNLCYKTYSNLIKLLQPGFDGQNDEQTMSSSSSSSYLSSPFTIRRAPPVSFDFTRQDLCKNCHRSSSTYPSQIPLTSFTRLSQRYFPNDYSIPNKPHFIYRGWSNRRTASYDKNIGTFDVQTQTDDSFLESSSLQTRLTMRRSLLSMFTMNIALTIKLICKIYPSVNSCILTGEFFQLEKQASQDLTMFIRSIMGQIVPHIYQIKRESLLSALGCVLPRVYFDIIDDEGVLGNDCIN